MRPYHIRGGEMSNLAVFIRNCQKGESLHYASVEALREIGRLSVTEIENAAAVGGIGLD